MTSRNTPKLWLYVHLAVIVCFFVFSWVVMAPIVAATPMPHSLPQAVKVSAVFSSFAMGVTLVFTVMMWTKERMKGVTRMWRRPSLFNSPLLRDQPLQALYLLAMMVASIGLGLLASMPWGSHGTLAPGIILLGIALGFHLGIRISLWVFRSKFAPAR